MRKPIPVLIALLLFSGVAHATQEYLCSVTYIPSTTAGYGSYGYIQAIFFTQPGCAGTQTALTYYCSNGATVSSCAIPAYCSGSDYTYSEVGITTLAQMLRGAAQQGQPLVRTTSCGNNTRGSYVFFQSP